MKASDICNHAAELVSGDRERTHGPKLENHAKIARMQQAFMEIRRDPTAPLGPLDVACLMVCLKLARTQLGAFNLDDWVDMAGYAGVGGEIAAELQGACLPENDAPPKLVASRY